jgi:Protein of unknown function (DUF1592)/Protein of unknown function (DUF1588)/Protein of unknown function (DUF1587)/Protein of unknown function (DUF1585)/Protein of unknown function (DUF1595)
MVLLALAILTPDSQGAENPAVARFEDQVQPILIDYCYGCHALGTKKGGVTFDEFGTGEAFLKDRNLWWAVLKNVRAGIMPPAEKPHPNPKEIGVLADWIKRDVFGSDPDKPDPGRVTIRRLNRVEYHNTIRDLMGIDFKAEEEFPPDDTGYGFDNIGDVLTVSPLLLEKYFQAAETIVKSAVPRVSKLIPERTYRGGEFRGEERGLNGDRLDFSRPASVSRTFGAEHPGNYRLALELAVQDNSRPDPGPCTIIFKVDDRELLHESYSRKTSKTFYYGFDQNLTGGEHRLSFEIQPRKAQGGAAGSPPAVDVVQEIRAAMTGAAFQLLTDRQRERNIVPDFRIVSVRIEGPMDPKYWARPSSYGRFFPRDEPPATDSERRRYTREVLARFVRNAFRRPADDRTLDRLIAIAEKVYKLPGKRFEEGIAQAMVAVLASPRFVFRIESVEPGQPSKSPALIDEYSLASRLSYFLWSTMPDDELFGLAGARKLRAELPRQVKRMLEDKRGRALTENFVGQWLEVRDLDGIFFNERAILRREGIRLKGADTERNVLTRDIRRAMRSETELAFEYVLRENRSVLEWIDCDYTFLNERLAKYYGIPGVEGSEVRRVTLPKDSPRGGVLTHGTILAVTSNPSRTSPVKRGQFILDNILGTPAPPPPPDIPALEDARKNFKDREPTTRELMALHRSAAMCNSCHSRMDPLGLALDNFNPLGTWRDAESGQKIDPSGRLITGEPFKDIRDLKRIIKERHGRDFYRCLTEKFLTYALGRGLEYYDVATVDRIVERLDQDGGRFSALLMGVIESAPFQKRRTVPAAAAEATASSGQSQPTRINP